MSLHKNLEWRRKAIKYKIQGDHNLPLIIQINYDYVLMANLVKLLSNTGVLLNSTLDNFCEISHYDYNYFHFTKSYQN